MTAIADLPREQSAVLSLVLGKGRSYAQIAELLRIDVQAVRDRAHAALEAIAPSDGTAPPPQRRTEVSDYLLGQQAAADAKATLGYLEGSAVGRAWARSLATELREVATTELPLIPAAAAEPTSPAPPPPKKERPSSGADAPTTAVSRRGGAILLGSVAAVVLLVLLLTGVFSGGSGKKPRSAASTRTAGAPQTKLLGQINLTPPNGRKGPAVGVATLLQQGTSNGIALQVTGLAPTSKRLAYAVWLFNSRTRAELIGLVPAVKADGKLGAIAPTPADIANFRALILTRETTPRPTLPGTIVLSGELPKHA